MTTLDQYLKQHNITKLEGHCIQLPSQVELLKRLCKDVKFILEIGFNGGHSSDLFLSSSNAQVVSFDIGYWDGVKIGKQYIDKTYPDRHLLIIGNSIRTIPRYPIRYFDLIFIDGDHDYRIAKLDLINCKRLAYDETIVMMDDTVFKFGWSKQWTRGPTRVWKQAISSRLIKELGREDIKPGRGYSWGRYQF